MIRKIAAAVVLIPLAILIVLLALANRHAVTISLDPLAWDKPAVAVTQPLFIVLLLAVLIGVVIGGVAAWLRQAKWRRAARNAQAEARALKSEADSLRERLEQAARTREPAAALGYRPPPAA